MEGNDAGMPAIPIPLTVLNSKSFSGQLSVSAGWYQLTLKATDSNGTTSTRTTKEGVGEVFIIAGQSNAQGIKNDPFKNNTVNLPLLDAVRVQPDRFLEAEFLGAADPFSQLITTTLGAKKPSFSPLISGREAYNDPNSGISPLGNSLWYWVAFGEKIARQYQVPVAVFNAAWNGTTIRQWQESTASDGKPLGAPGAPGDGRYGVGAPYGIFKNALKFYGSTYGIRSVLWLQGETDAKALRDAAWAAQRVSGSNPTAQKQDYADKLTQVINKSRQDLQPRAGDDALAWVVGKTSTFEGVSVYYPKQGQTQAETQSAQTVRAGQEQVITAGLKQVYRGPDIDAIEERAVGGGEPTHLAGQQGLVKAAEAWYFSVHTPSFFNPDPIRPARLGTEPQDLQLDANGNITTPLPAGAQYVWYAGNGGRIDLNTPAGFGYTMPDGIADPVVFVDYSDGNCALGGLVLPDMTNSTPTPTGNCSVGSPNAAFDVADCNGVSGWALDQTNMNQTVTVDIYVDGAKTYSVSANGDRQDLVGAFGGNQAARYHGFTYQFPANASWKNGQNHTLTARICGAANDMAGSPKQVSGCTGGTQTPTTPTTPSGNCGYSEGQFLLNFNGELIYAHYYNGILFAAYQNASQGFKPQHWMQAAGFDPSKVPCFAATDPRTTTTTNPTTTPSGSNNGSGLLGSYYNNTNLSGSPVKQQVDATVNFAWNEQGPSPAAGANPTNMSVRWSGQVEAPVSGTYKFKTLNDDATRLSVNGQQLINDWPGGHGPTWFEGSINLTAGQKYTISLEFNQGGGGAQAQLHWEYPGQGSQIIPQSRLYPDGATIPTTPTTPTNPPTGNCSVGSPNAALDVADCNGVSGWALDQNNMNQTVTVDIYVDGVKTHTGIVANGDRQDLVGAFGGNPAARYHGFTYQFPANASWKNGQNHTLTARICGAGNDMAGSPKQVSGCTGGTQNPTTPTNPTTPNGTGSLAFQIVSYNCNSGVLQYKFSSNDGSPVSVTLPGIFGGNMNPNTIVSHTFPGDARQGYTVTGSASQSGNQIGINFTNGCNLPSGGRKASSVLSDVVDELALSVRPNPNNGQFDVEVRVPANQTYVVGVTDLLGRVLVKQEGVGSGLTQVESISLQNRYAGAAIVYLKSGAKRVSKTVLIKP
ncbi:hypothetical protein GCM10027190_33960 [Spirosoma areae]